MDSVIEQTLLFIILVSQENEGSRCQEPNLALASQGTGNHTLYSHSPSEISSIHFADSSHILIHPPPIRVARNQERNMDL